MGSKPQISDEMFLAAWIECNYNSKDAYLKLSPGVTDDSAKTLGSRKLASCKASEVYKSLLDKAYETMYSCLDAKNENVRLGAAKDLIDRHNGKAKENIKSEVEVTFKTVKYGDNDSA